MLKKCDGRTDEHTDLCIELRYAQLIIYLHCFLVSLCIYNSLVEQI